MRPDAEIAAEIEGLCAKATPPQDFAHYIVNALVEVVHDDIPGSVDSVFFVADAFDKIIRTAAMLLPEAAAALRRRPGRKEVEKRLQGIADFGESVGTAYEFSYGAVERSQNERDEAIRALLRDLGYGDER